MKSTDGFQIANAGYQAITIPTCIENGQYLLRPELLALHAGKFLIWIKLQSTALTILQLERLWVHNSM